MTCPVCALPLTAADFYRNAARSSGFSYACRRCTSARNTATYHARVKLPAHPTRPARRLPPPPLFP